MGKKIAKRELTGHFGIGYNTMCAVYLTRCKAVFFVNRSRKAVVEAGSPADH